MDASASAAKGRRRRREDANLDWMLLRTACMRGSAVRARKCVCARPSLCRASEQARTRRRSDLASQRVAFYLALVLCMHGIVGPICQRPCTSRHFRSPAADGDGPVGSVFCCAGGWHTDTDWFPNHLLQPSRPCYM